MPRKRVGRKRSRGFESLPLRHFLIKNTKLNQNVIERFRKRLSDVFALIMLSALGVFQNQFQRLLKPDLHEWLGAWKETNTTGEH